MREEIFLPTTRDRLRSLCTHHLSHCCMIGRIDRVVSAQVARLFGTNRTRRPASPLPSRWMFVDLEAVGKLHPTARDIVCKDGIWYRDASRLWTGATSRMRGEAV